MSCQCSKALRTHSTPAVDPLARGFHHLAAISRQLVTFPSEITKFRGISWRMTPPARIPIVDAVWICLLTVPVLAQTPTSAPGILLKGGAIHTVSGSVIENGSVLVRDGNIVGVGGDLGAPERTIQIGH